MPCCGGDNCLRVGCYEERETHARYGYRRVAVGVGMKWFWAAMHEQFATSPATLNRIIGWNGREPVAVLSATRDALSQLFGETAANRIQEAKSTYEEREPAYEELQARNVQCVTSADDEYPVRLRPIASKAPIVYLAGNTRTLDSPSVGICGSQRATADALKHARGFGRIGAEYGLTVVSGYAKGVDSEAHLGALEEGGQTVAVLAEGIANLRERRFFKNSQHHSEEGSLPNFLAVSQFPPFERWHSYNAMARNKVICSLSDAIVVVEAGQTGGTLDAGRQCLAQRKPLWVIEYKHNPSAIGNRQLVAEGAHTLRTPRELKQVLVSLSQRSASKAAHGGADSTQQRALIE